MLYRRRCLQWVLLVFLLIAGTMAVQAKTNITFVHWYATDTDLGQAIGEFVSEFEAQHPDIEVDSQFVSWGDFPNKVLVQIAGGVSPDVSLVSGFWFGDFARTGIFLPVDQWLRGTSVSISDFYQGSAEQAKFEGQYYAIPFAGGPQRALWYKVSIFEEVGLNPHDPPTTWDKLLAYSKRLVLDKDGDGVVDRYAVNSDNLLDMWAIANGAVSVSADGTKLLWTTPPYVEAMEFMLQLRTENLAGSGWLSEVLSGRITMLVGGSWLRGYLEARADDVQLASFPRNSPAGRYYHSADMFSVYRSTLSSQGKTEAGARFGAYLVSPQVQARWAMQTGFPPMNMKAVRQPEYLRFVQRNQAQWVATEMMERLYPAPLLPAAAEIHNIQLRYANDILNRRTPLMSGLENAAAEANARLAEGLRK